MSAIFARERNGPNSVGPDHRPEHKGCLLHVFWTCMAFMTQCSGCVQDGVISPAAQSVGSIRYVHLLILTEKAGERNLNEKLAGVFEREYGPDARERRYLSGDLKAARFVDGWGQELVVRFVADEKSELDRIAILGFAIWSVGLNGTDDGGTGDDIVLPEYLLDDLRGHWGQPESGD